MELSTKDRGLIKSLWRAGVLQDVEEHLIDQKNGVIIITCSDGDRFPDVFQYQVKMQMKQRPDPRIHVLAWHGGALACAPCSPINKRKHADLVFLDQVSDAREMKGINTVVLYAHAICSAAHLNGVDIEESLALQIRAKSKIKTLNSGIVVVPFFHVDYGEGRKQTYFVSRENWERWASTHGIRSIA